MDGSLKIIIPKSFSNDEKGNFFETFTGTLLSKIRYGVTSRIRFTGMEIDLIAEHKDTHEKCYVECKFQTDPIGAGVVTDLIGKAIVKRIDTIFLFSMSELGKEAKGLVEEYTANEKQPIKLVVFPPGKIFEIYVDQHNLKEPNFNQINGKFGALYLVITPNSTGNTWIQLSVHNGVPSKGFVISDTKNFEISEFIRDISQSVDNELHEIPLELLSMDTSSKGKMAFDPDDEIISEISIADSFDDYRPCRPDDYVGRDLLQKQIWDHLESVLEKQSDIRIISISGSSGYGKSSTIIKLADRFKNRKWKGKFYLYDVDVRSAKSSLYIHKSIRRAIEKAKIDGFLSQNINNSDILNISNIFQSDDLKKTIEELRDSNKVLVIFFDQFEELFTKVELFGVFEMFKRLCLEVDSMKENIVLGFSWRTGISFNDNHPAYHLWHELDDKRKDFSVKALSTLETSTLITKFENDILKQKLDKVVRRRIIEQSQGLPWLLKKLLVHVGKQIKEGKNQNDLIVGKFNIAPLFQEDLETLNDTQVGCLKHIANNSPIDLSTITENFPAETVNYLYTRRLIIRSGHKYSVYWDIFRDFLKTNEVPNLPLTYIPKTTITSVAKILNLFNGTNELSFDEMIAKTGYTSKSGMNVLSDGLMFSLIQKSVSGGYIYNSEINNDLELRKFLNSQLKEHSVIHSLQQRGKYGEKLTINLLAEVIDELHKEEHFSSASLRSYSNVLLSWFQWASVLAVTGESIQLIEKPDFKAVVLKGRGRGRGAYVVPIFMGSSGPLQAYEVIKIIKANALVESYKIKYRNSLADLRALSVISTKESSQIVETLLSLDDFQLYREVLARVQNSDFIKLVQMGITQNNGIMRDDFSELISTLGKTWSDSSILRYVNSGKRWIKEIEKFKT